MAEMTPRERSELVRSQARAYIATLRESRLQRGGKTLSPPPTAKSLGKTPSAFYPSRQATARASEAKAKPAVPAQAVVPAAESPTREVDVRLGQLRDARRTRKPRASKSGAAVLPAAVAGPRSKDASATKADATIMPNAQPVSKDLPKTSTAQPDLSRIKVDDPAALPVAQRRVRARKSPSNEPPSGFAGNAATPRDIDVISGLGPALKSKLRRAGMGTADILASQTSERLREVLGPAGRLVNLDALVRAAATACASA